MPQKKLCMIISNPLSRGLGKIAKVCVMRCSCQSTCAEERNTYEFCPVVGHTGIALIVILIVIAMNILNFIVILLSYLFNTITITCYES